jgi:hypothetical protein
MDVIAEDYPFLELFSTRGRKSDEPAPLPTLEERTISRTPNVSINGKVNNGTIGDFLVTSVQVDR